MATSPNLNVFHCDAGTFSISDAINGQTPLVMYDALKQAALLPALRQLPSGGGALAIMPYDVKTPEALFAQMQAAFGYENRTVTATEYYWLEYDAYDTQTFVVDKSSATIPAAGASVTVNINGLSKSGVGNYVKPLPGFYAYIKELNRQKVYISAAPGATVTLQPINGEVLNLTDLSRYTIVIDPMRHYTKGDTSDMVVDGMVLAPPAMYKSWIQSFEKSFAVHDDEVTNYAYDRDFKVFKGVDTRGQVVDMFYIPTLNNQIEGYMTDNQNENILFGQRDLPNQKGFDGLIPMAERYGMFNSGYDVFNGASLKQILWSMMKTLRRINGCTDYMLAHDFSFSMDWSDNIAEMVKAANQSYRYELFGEGGTGIRDFSYYEFQAFSAFGYKFTPYMLDIFDARRYGNILEYFAIMMPLAKFRDQKGNSVPFVTRTNLVGAEPAKVDSIWIDDARKRGGRTIRVYGKTTYGYEFHRPTSLGTIRKTSTS